MFQFKQMFLCLLLGTLLSCGQNPLKAFPKEMQEGVLKTGFQHFANFEDVLVEKLLKVDIVGRNDLTMDFSEGADQSYTIRFRLLNSFSSKYELIIEGNPFSDLPNSQWNYDSKKQMGTLSWRPSETFTWSNQYIKSLIPLSIQLKKRGLPNKGSIFTVNRDFTVFVSKTYTPPKIFRVKMEHDSYVNLSDGKWYRDYLLYGLNLSFYDDLYVGEKKKTEVNDNFIFYTVDFYVSFSDPSKFTNKQRDAIGFKKEFNYFRLTDKREEIVPVELAFFIKQPYYYSVSSIEAGSDCISEQPAFLKESLCLAPLRDLNFVNLSEELYVKFYSIPSHVKKEQIYYKVESKALCGVYHEISADFIIHKQKKWNFQESCYLSWDKLDLKEIPGLKFLGLNKPPITDDMEIYLLKDDNHFELVDRSKWSVVFYKIPDYIKWQLGGHQPVAYSSATSILPINLSRVTQKSSLQFDLKDTNHSTTPYFIFEEKEYRTLIQNIPIKWHFKNIINDIGSIGYVWKRFYNISLIDWLEKDKYNKLYEFLFSLRPVSSGISGEAVQLKFNILPSIKANYVELFDPIEDFKILTHVKRSDEGEEWKGFDVSIESQIKERYIFQHNFKQNILKAMPFTDKQTNIEDLIMIRDHEPKSNYACRKTEYEPFFESTCECSKFVYYEEELEDLEVNQSEDKPFYMESICSYKSKLKLDTGKVNEDHQIISAYWNYNYSVNTELGLKSASAEGNDYSRIPLSIDKEYLNKHPMANKQDKGFNLHIFFNLEPEINCFSEIDSSQKTCQVRYYFDKTSSHIDLLTLNADEFFFSEQGVQVDMACLDDALEIQSCGCDSMKFVVKEVKVGQALVSRGSQDLIDKRSFLEVECSMEKTKKGFIDLSLKTTNPYIYFLDPEVNDDIKSTVFKRLNIE